MKTDQHFFLLEDQWNIVHLPDKPNGFAIIIIGDTNHYVTESTSLWIQHMQRFNMIEYLREEGYTIFYSNLYGPNWGSPRAVELLQSLYHIMIRKYTLNHRIHLLAEGMGGFTALQFMKKMEGSIRSAAMLSPCLDLKAHLNGEKENKLFYKRLIKEMSVAYGVEEKQVEHVVVNELELADFLLNTPVKIWHTTEGTNYQFNEHSRSYEQIRKENNLPIFLTLYLSEKKYGISQSIKNFFRDNETEL